METGEEGVSGSRKATRAEKLQIIFLILLLVAIATLIICIVVVLKYKDMLNDPLAYNLDKFNLQSCRCLDKDGKSLEIYSSDHIEIDLDYIIFDKNVSK